jgi:hypothetical protein
MAAKKFSKKGDSINAQTSASVFDTLNTLFGSTVTQVLGEVRDKQVHLLQDTLQVIGKARAEQNAIYDKLEKQVNAVIVTL